MHTNNISAGTIWKDNLGNKVILIRPSHAQEKCWLGYCYNTNDKDFWYEHQLREKWSEDDERKFEQQRKV